jgi:hypothetical protein
MKKENYKRKKRRARKKERSPCASPENTDN